MANILKKMIKTYMPCGNQDDSNANSMSIFKPDEKKLYNHVPVITAQHEGWVRNATEEVKRLYNVKNELLGSGAFGKVYQAEDKSNQNVKYAIKIIPTKRMSESMIRQMHQEMEILFKLDHPFIVTQVEAFEDQKYIYIVMERVQGQNLGDLMEQKGVFTEADAAELIYKVIQALNHVHSCGVVHRDLKPENVMINENGDPRIIDFGLSKDTKNQTIMLKSMVGSKIFMAPEIIDGSGHSCPSDMWSLGIILYMMLSGGHPFSSRCIEKEICEAPVLWLPPNKWENVSSEAKDLITKLLDKCPTTRLTARGALDHPWFKKQGVYSMSIESNKQSWNDAIIEKLRSYKGISKLRRAALSIYQNMLEYNQVQPLREIFQAMDIDKSGFIDANELMQAIKMSTVEIPDDQIQSIIDEVDYEGNGKINQAEFLAATISLRHSMTDDQMWCLFKHFDIDDSYSLSKSNIKIAMANLGKIINDKEVDEIFDLHDINSDGFIYYDEFKKMLLDQPGVDDFISNDMDQTEDEDPADCMLQHIENGVDDDNNQEQSLSLSPTSCQGRDHAQNMFYGFKSGSQIIRFVEIKEI